MGQRLISAASRDLAADDVMIIIRWWRIYKGYCLPSGGEL